MNRELIVELASKGCMAYDDYDPASLLEKATACEAAGIKPEEILVLANRCCGMYEFYNPIRLLRKAVECNSAGYDPVCVLESAIRNSECDFQPVRVLSRVIEEQDEPPDTCRWR